MTNTEYSEAEFDAACARAASLVGRRIVVQPNGPMGTRVEGTCSSWDTDGHGGVTVIVDTPAAGAVDGYRQVEAWLADVIEHGPSPSPTLARMDAHDAEIDALIERAAR